MNTTTQTTNNGAAVSSVRAQTSQLVTSVAIQTGESRGLVWLRIYTRLETAFGVRLHAYPRQNNESLLSVAERNGLINEVYSLAYAEHLYLQEYEE